MAKQKRKLTPAEKRAKAQRKRDFMIIFVNGKQKRVRRPVLIDGLEPDEFIRRNADPIGLHQNEMWEYMPEVGVELESDEADSSEEFVVTLVEGIARGEKAVEDGRAVTHAEATRRMARWLK